MILRRHLDFAFGWSRLQPDRGFDFNGTALVTPEKVLLVDPIAAMPDELVQLGALRGGTRRFEIVLLTCDHERSAAAFARAFGATVWVPAADAVELTLRDAHTYAPGHDFGGGWIAHAVPDQKTPGETALYNAALRTLVVGDAVIADPVTGLRLPPPAKIRDRTAALAALRTLAALDFDALLVGDGFVLPTGGREALRRFLEKEGA